MTDKPPSSIVYIAAPGVLEGPYAALRIGEVHIEIFTRVGHSNRISRHHGKLAREGAEQHQAHHPNPSLIPLDMENAGEPGGPFVFARVTDGRFPLK